MRLNAQTSAIDRFDLLSSPLSSKQTIRKSSSPPDGFFCFSPFSRDPPHSFLAGLPPDWMRWSLSPKLSDNSFLIWKNGRRECPLNSCFFQSSSLCFTWVRFVADSITNKHLTHSRDPHFLWDCLLILACSLHPCMACANLLRLNTDQSLRLHHLN